MGKVVTLTVCIGIFLIVIYPYELNKVFLFNRLVEVLSIVLIFTDRRSLNKHLSPTVLKSIFAFVILSFISALMGMDFYKSIWGNFYRHDGLFTLLHLVTFSLLVSLMWKNRLLLSVAKAVIIANIIISVIGLFQFYLHPLEPIGSSFIQPNFLAGYLLATLPFVFLTDFRFCYKIAYVFLAISVILLTRSLGAMLGVIIFFVILGWIQHRVSTKLMMITVVVSVGIGTLFLLKSINTGTIKVAESRERIYTKALLAISKRPLLGWGWANFDYAFDQIDWPIHYELDAHVDKAHSSLLEVASTAGLATLVIYIGLIILIIKYLNNKLLLVSFILFLFHSQTNAISVAEEIFFWLYAGIAAIRPPVEKT